MFKVFHGMPENQSHPNSFMHSNIGHTTSNRQDRVISLSSASNGNSPEILELQDFIRDACSFTTAFAVNPVCRSTPHLYLSMLPLIPVQNRVRANYRSRSPGILWLNGTTMSRREGVALATWEADCGVTTVVYSPDSMRIAYGCCDGTIYIWNTFYGIRSNI
ncbi:hypothetical protein RhiTH_010096 [Rhizoctonia solani]